MTAASSPETVNLSLVSHTNVGKTSLMRTLLRKDIGEIADRPHVTEAAEAHVLVTSAQGEDLRLWDTPGFGDSARLLKRLEASGNPLGWLQTQVWDRLTDRPFFSSQQAIRNVREESDVVLYLVNASEDPGAARYVDAELRILAWTGKPVLVLLNQTGPARGRAADLAEETAWSRALAEHVQAHRVMTLDAFARCWVQEDRLLGGVAELLPAERRPAFDRLRAAWRARNLEIFEASMRSLAEFLADVAMDREPLEGAATAGDLVRGARRFLKSLGSGNDSHDLSAERAMNALARRLDEKVRVNTDRLIALHGLSGRAAAGILARLAGQFEVAKPADVKTSSILGGMVTGALGGLVADISAAGLTFGAGAFIGGILGALGAGGAAQAYNVMHGIEEGRVRWSAQFLSQRPVAALLRYLAVAHYGRGRGDWSEGEYPPHWRALAQDIVARRRAEFGAAWATVGEGVDREQLVAMLQPLLRASAKEALVSLYPDCRGMLEQGPPG